MLNILEGYPDLAADDARRLHLMIEAMKLAYADRATFLGDPASVDAPLARLLSKNYAAKLRARIDAAQARPARDIYSGGATLREGGNTTHFSVVDRFGNAVSNTTTLNFSYGLGLVADGTGILLNNELDDFAAKPGAPNAFGLVGGAANAPGPGKRPLSSMTPTIVLKDGKPFIVTGSPGGSRIITAVLQVILNVIDRKLSIADAVAEPRIHHQWLPDEVMVERGLRPDLIRALEARGHTVVERLPPTSANSILVTAGRPRRRARQPHPRRAGRGLLDRSPACLLIRRTELGPDRPSVVIRGAHAREPDHNHQPGNRFRARRCAASRNDGESLPAQRPSSRITSTTRFSRPRPTWRSRA